MDALALMFSEMEASEVPFHDDGCGREAWRRTEVGPRVGRYLVP